MFYISGSLIWIHAFLNQISEKSLNYFYTVMLKFLVFVCSETKCYKLRLK
jgi:hypothetical protein